MLKSFIALAALTAAGAANAGVVTLFEDDFDSYTPALGITTTLGSKWTVSGNVDIVQSGTFGISCDGRCLDLDGTGSPERSQFILSVPIAFQAGAPLTISYDMSGNQRSSTGEILQILLTFSPAVASGGIEFYLPVQGPGSLPPSPGITSASASAPIPGNLPWDRYFITLNPLSAGTVQVRFATVSSDNIGPLLDNVLVTQGVVPEPATWAMLIAGFGLVGMVARRRRATTVTA